MINPINFNKINIQGMQAKSQTTDKTAQTSRTMELSGFETGRAIFARNNISFRNLTQPIEVTELYNKKTEGKDHLDLPNIHVYEYPDTNLQVFVNADENIMTDENSVLNKPKILIMLENNDYKNHDFVKNKFIQTIFEKRTPQIFANNFIISSDFDSFDEVKTFNERITDTNFRPDEIEVAKEKLKDFFASDKNNIGKAFYAPKELKSNDEIMNEVNNMTCEDLENYYKKCLNNSSVQAFVTVSKDYFNENKSEILKSINENLKYKFMDTEKTVEPEFILNDTLRTVNGATDALCFPTKAADSKDAFINDIAIQILNKHTQYEFKSDYFSMPIELKNDTPIKYNLAYCYVNTDNPVAFIQDIKNIGKLDLTNDVDKAKAYFKDRLKTTFTGERLDVIKNWELCSYNDSIFNLYETIDSINQDDIKNYINKYLIEQKPVITKERKDKDENQQD